MKTEKIEIGTLVKEVLRQRGFTQVEVAGKMGISKQRFDKWLKKDDWEVKKLFTLSQIVGYDFVALFVQPKAEEPKSKLTLQIEITGSKKDEVMKVIGDKDLYNLVVGTE